MKIIIDENVPYARQFFSHLGDVELVPGRQMSPANIGDAEVLIVRSVTEVNQALLTTGATRFVGSCTIGTDHLDIDWLNQRGIAWTAAPGCNAQSVVEYVLAALSALEPCWLQKSVAIVGGGNVGGRLYRCLSALGVRCRVVDPALSANQQPDLIDLPEALAADVICLHTPLTESGPYPTHHLIGGEQLKQLPEHSVLLNAGRGAVIDNNALLRHLVARPKQRVVLDVWEAEPEVHLPLLKRVSLATPHVAGYSLEGKARGTEQVYQALCQHLGVEPQVMLEDLLPPVQPAVLNWCGSRLAEDMTAYLRQCYDIKADDQRTRLRLQSSSAVAKDFDWLRKYYPERRQFSARRLPAQLQGELAERLHTMGFGQ